MTPTKIFVLTGPTASGKTALSLALAEKIDGEIVSADSMQIYTGMDIGTAKPTVAQRRGIPHHMLDVVSPEESFSVAQYVAMAQDCVRDIARRGKVPIVVGGTGLYLEYLIRGSSFAPVPQDAQLRLDLEQRIAQEGGESLLSALAEVDPITANRLFPNDHKRIVRAMEVYTLTGKPLSQFDAESKTIPSQFDACQLALNFQEREDLRQRIYQRVDQMLEDGLLAEVESFLPLPRDCTAMQAIGYKELRGVLLGEESLEAGVELLKIRSRQYAKRQLTWFRNRSQLEWYNWEKTPNIQKALHVSTELWTRFQV